MNASKEHTTPGEKVMDRKRTNVKHPTKFYTYNVSFSFEMQFTFPASDVEPASEGGKNDFDPTDEALSALEKEVKEYLSENYTIGDIEAFADFDSLLGVTE
jgi:hypothetical protein